MGVMADMSRVRFLVALASVWLCAGNVQAADAPQPAKAPVCQPKWIAAGNNGAKADRYYRPVCS